MISPYVRNILSNKNKALEMKIVMHIERWNTTDVVEDKGLNIAQSNS